MEVGSYQPLAQDTGVHCEGNQKEVGTHQTLKKVQTSVDSGYIYAVDMD